MFKSVADIYKEREVFHTQNPPPVKPYTFDRRIHYPFGAGVQLVESFRDVVYRRVPVYTPDMHKMMVQSVASGAASSRPKILSDVGSGVPKAPHIRELFVDAVTGQPIGEYYFCFILFIYFIYYKFC